MWSKPVCTMVGYCCSMPIMTFVQSSFHGCRKSSPLYTYYDALLTRWSRRNSWRSNSISRQRRYRLHRSRYRDRQLGLLGHRALRHEAIPAVREVCLDPSAPCAVRAYRLCRTAVRCLDCLSWRLGDCGSESAFLLVDVSLRAEFMVGSCFGLLRLLSGDDVVAQGCVTDHRWSMAVIQSGVHDRVRNHLLLSSCGLMIRQLLTSYEQYRTRKRHRHEYFMGVSIRYIYRGFDTSGLRTAAWLREVLRCDGGARTHQQQRSWHLLYVYCLNQTFLLLGMLTCRFPAATMCAQVLGRAFQAIPRWIWGCVFIMIQLVLGLAGRNSLYTILSNFLALMGYWVEFMVLIVLMERYIFRRHARFEWSSLDKSCMPLGIASATAFLLGWLGAILGMYQTWYIGPLAKLAKLSDVGVWVGMAFTVVSFPILRYLEISRFGR